MRIFRVIVAVAVFFLCLCSNPSAWAISSVNVPLDSWVYPALDKLESYGLIDSAVSDTRPYTRLEVAPSGSEAKEKWERFQSSKNFTSFAKKFIPSLFKKFQGNFDRTD